MIGRSQKGLVSPDGVHKPISLHMLPITSRWEVAGNLLGARTLSLAPTYKVSLWNTRESQFMAEAHSWYHKWIINSRTGQTPAYCKQESIYLLPQENTDKTSQANRTYLFMHHICKHKYSLYVYNKALGNSSVLTLCFPWCGQLAISKHAQGCIQSQQSASFHICYFSNQA